MNSMRPQMSALSMRDRQAVGSAPAASIHGQEGAGTKVRVEVDIKVPREKLCEAAMAYWEAPHKLQTPPSWSPRAFREDLDATGGWKLEGVVPSLELLAAAATASKPVPKSARAEQETVTATGETRRRSARLVLTVLTAVLAAVGVDAYLGGNPHHGLLEQIDGAVLGTDEASAPAQATAWQASQEVAPATTAERHWVVGRVIPVSPARANRVDGIDWVERGSETVITIRGNGSIDTDAVSLHQMDGPPRLLVKLSGIEEQYPLYRVAVGTPAVNQIRIGHHPEQTPSCLYVVLDLAQGGIEVSGIELENDLVKVVVRPS